MNTEDYPPQEPLSDFAKPYHQKVLRLGHGAEPVEYFFGNSAYQSLAVFKPEVPNGSVLIMWHGGGWTNGYKEWMYFVAPALIPHGITFISAGYRLAPQHVFPAGFTDCARAIAWVYKNAIGLNTDPTRIFLSGHSAGGHYASLLAVRSDWQTQFDIPEDTVRGCLPISGVYDFGRNSGLSVRPRFLSSLENLDRASPLTSIDRVPPFLITYGGDDFPHLRAQAKAMEDKLKLRGGDVQSIELKDQDHLGTSLASGEVDGSWPQTAAKWIETH